MMLKWMRRTLAAVSLATVVAALVLPWGYAAVYLGWIARVQFVPAAVSGSLAIVISLLVAAGVSGRFYCSAVCPLGILQDLVRAAARLCRVPALRFRGGRLLSAIRFAFLVAAVVLWTVGLVGIVDPYGIFGRFVSVGILRGGDPGLALFVFSLLLPTAILLAAAAVPRAWCSVVCPVGTLLGVFARFSVFRIRIKADSCVKCGRCVKRCEKGALTVRADRSIAVDTSRCVLCGDCLGVCKNLSGL